MTVKSICEMGTGALKTLADMMNDKATEISRKDTEKARELIITATSLRQMAKAIGNIGGDRL